MHLEAHAGLGWALGVLAPTSDRRLRALAVVAAVLPDVDVVSWLAGQEAYMRYHHTFGHNVFLGLVVANLAFWLRGRVGAAVAALAFASHLLTDMKLSAYPVHIFWPMRGEYEFTPNHGLASPVNTALVYIAIASVLPLALFRGVTPLELLHPRLDRLFTDAFRKKPHACATCERACNQRCERCEKPVCSRHARVSWRFRITCPDVRCASSSPGR